MAHENERGRERSAQKNQAQERHIDPRQTTAQNEELEDRANKKAVMKDIRRKQEELPS
jgi:hypothetical protein